MKSFALLFLRFLLVFIRSFLKILMSHSQNPSRWNGWRVDTPLNTVSPHDWKWYSNMGLGSLSSLRMKIPGDSNYVASP